jgi:hypothetical protein
MALDRTRLRARQLDRERRRAKLPDELTLLTLSGKTAEGVATYDSVKAVSDGWLVEPARGGDGGAYTRLQIADSGGDLREAIDGAGDTDRTTHFSAAGLVYRIEPDQTLRPVGEPKIWELRGYEVSGTYDG